MRVDGRQLKAMIKAEAEALSEVARGSRANLKKVVRGAAKNKVDFLVLPEWAVLPQNLLWLMEESSRKQMLVVGGQTPEVVNGEYLNRLWTGIPIKDSAGHRACLVPPPRQKKFLSPEEKADIHAGEITAPPGSDVAIYLWRGIRFASFLCFEFADVGMREEVRFASDLLTVSSWNRDWRYFEAVQDATTRDNYCLVLCVNTGAIPGTRITRPTSSAKAVASAVHGSDDATVITKRIDMRPILVAQAYKCRPSERLEDPLGDDVSVRDYKPFPPDKSRCATSCLRQNRHRYPS